MFFIAGFLCIYLHMNKIQQKFEAKGTVSVCCSVRLQPLTETPSTSAFDRNSASFSLFFDCCQELYHSLRSHDWQHQCIIVYQFTSKISSYPLASQVQGQLESYPHPTSPPSGFYILSVFALVSYGCCSLTKSRNMQLFELMFLNWPECVAMWLA